MKFAFIADLHLSGYTQDRIDKESNLPERLNSLRNVLHNMAKYCLENGIEKIVIGGDSLHGKSIIYAIAQDIMVNFFVEYQNIKFYVIDGNHDLSGKGDNAISALSSLLYLPNVSWISQDPETVNDIMFIPYSSHIVEQVKSNKSKVLISHFGLNEGVLNSGVSIVSDIKLADLVGKYELVLLGHYHKPQEIIQPQIKVYYSGSPIQLDWGEKNEEKRFLVVDTDVMSVDSVPTTGYKRYIEFTLTKENKENVIDQAKKLQEDGNYVKMVKNIEMDIDDLKDEFRVIDKVEKDITNRGLSSSMTDQERIKKYLEIKKVKDQEYENVAMTIIEASKVE